MGSRINPWMGALFAMVVGTTAAGCEQSKFDDIRGEQADPGNGHDDDRPGSDARENDEDISCESEDDCLGSEMCLDGVCQMPRCTDGPYLSDAPMAAKLRLFEDREILVADTVASSGSYYIDGYAPLSGSIDYPGSWSVGENKPQDIAGGDFFGTGEEGVASVAEGSTDINVVGQDPLPLAFPPIALAAGDLDQDGKDELVALGQFGNVAMCQVDEADCVSFLIQNGNGVDATIGDIDGDGYGEAVFLLEQSDQELIYIWDADGDAVDDGGDIQGPAGHDIKRIDAGDVNGDGVDELYTVEFDSLLGSANMYTYSAADGEVLEVGSQSVDNGTRDVAVADLDADEHDEVLLLRGGGMMELLRGGESGVSPWMTHQMQVSSDPERISASDFDADSPRTQLMNDEAVLLPGPVMPVAVAYFPPYDSQFSNGRTSKVTIGLSESMDESFSDSIALGATIDVGVGGGLFGLFKGGVGARVGREIKKRYGEGTRQRIGMRVSAAADPKLNGQNYGLVFLQCACFHAYYYQVSDPSHILSDEADSEEFVVLLPVGGTTTMWSTKRYNAMAEAVGDLPIVEVPYTIGDVSSYPNGPERADGSPIGADDFVFDEVPSFLVSDVGSVGARVTATEYKMNETAVSTKVDLSAKLDVGPFNFGVGGSLGFSESHRIRVGESAMFGASVPAIPDNPSTPEDEYLENAFSFVPYVYREHYTDRDGDDASYYVVSFAVAEE